MPTPTREQLIENIKAMESQGAPQADIQAYLDQFKGSAPSAPKPATPQGDGFVKGAIKALANPFMRVGANLANAVDATRNVGRSIKDIATGSKSQKLDTTDAVSYGKFLGEAKPFGQKDGGFIDFTMDGKRQGNFTGNLKESAGVGLDAASTIVAGGGTLGVAKAGLRGAVKQGAITGAREGATAGFLGGTGKGLQEDKTVVGALGQGLKEGAIGGLVGGAIGGAVPIPSKIVREGVGKVQAIRAKAGKELEQKVMPSLTAKEIRLAKEQGRATRGKDSKIFGKDKDVVTPDRRTKKAIETLKRRIPGVEKLDDLQISGEAKTQIEGLAKTLKPEMEKVSLKPESTSSALTRWDEVKKTQAADVDFDDFGGTKMQSQFERFLKEAVEGADQKSGKFRTRNLNDVWDVAKKYDEVIPQRVKQANEKSEARLQFQKDQWLENRRILRDILEDNTEGLGKSAKEAFSDMSDLYRIRENITGRTDLDKIGGSGYAQKLIVGGAVTAAGALGLGAISKAANAAGN